MIATEALTWFTFHLQLLDYLADNWRWRRGAGGAALGAAASGQVTAAAFWPGTYIDWATHESSVIDAEAYTINSVASHPARIRGPVADLFAGGQDQTLAVVPLWRPNEIKDVA